MARVIVGRWDTKNPDKLAEQLERFERRLLETQELLERRSRPLELVRGEDGKSFGPGQIVLCDGNANMTIILRKPTADDIGVPVYVIRANTTLTVTVVAADATISNLSSISPGSQVSTQIDNDGENYWRQAI